MKMNENEAWNQLEDDDDLLLVDCDVNLNTSSLRSDERYVGFDNNVGDTWIYPSNFPERAYQYNIVQKAMFHNTLVVLPTGLGKTFIAAVVMYNMYRWYPMGKVIFMAPTRPLVAQQIDACCKIMGIPKADSVEITGKLNKATRAQLWQTKRVFFATPQSVQSDLLDRELNFPFQAVKLVVVDEAHRAKGRYAYTDVIRCIWSKNKYFRILALSATPGRRKDDVEEVIRNLFISNLEVRTEDSVDVISYVHKRQMKTVVVELDEKLSAIRDELLEIADPHIRNLIDNRLIAGRPGRISRNWLVMEHKKFRESLVNNRTPYQKELSSDFSICISVYHAIELLERHGLRVFLNNFDETQDAGAKFVVILRPDLRRLIDRVREEIGPNPFAFSDQCMVNGEIAPIPPNIDFGHPKFEIARDHVLTHFENNKESRVIIFCEYRESVMLMHRLLLQHRPLIRPRVFVGQGGTGSIRAVTQQQQIRVMNDFRSGESNALIATSVAEEGIDVGEVDLIVCFDINTTNPTRFIQRIGRTGRKKEGKVLLLATAGKEHNVLKEVLSERNKLNKSISRGGEFASVFYKQAPRMVPTEFNPKCMKTFIQNTPGKEQKSKVRPAQTLSKGHRVTKVGQKRDLRHYFQHKVILDEEEKCVFEDTEAANSSKASISSSKRTVIPDEDQAAIDFSPPKLTEISNKMVRKIAKYVRSSSKCQTVDVYKSLTSNRLSEHSIQFLLDFSPDLLSNVWAQMLRIWEKGIDENKMPTKGITAEERQVVRAYLQIVNILGSKENIANLVESRRETPNSFYFSKLNEKYSHIFGHQLRHDLRQNNFEFLMEKFEKISLLFSSDECSKQSFAQSMVYDDDIDEISNATARFNESSCDYRNDCILDSKYMSQWEESLDHTNTDDYSFVCKLPQPLTAVNEAPVEDSLIKNTMQVAKSHDMKHITATKNDIDDDVVFVGITQQSTPIRKGSPKQSLLNFNETPIASTVAKRPFKRLLTAKRGQQKCLDFIKTFKPKNKSIAVSLPENNSNKLCRRTPGRKSESPNEAHVNFFDDQFDAIIAANSEIIEIIENSNTISKKCEMDLGGGPSHQTTNDSISHRNIETDRNKQLVSQVRDSTASTAMPTYSTGVNDITTDGNTYLGANDSTPDDIGLLPDDSGLRAKNSTSMEHGPKTKQDSSDCVSVLENVPAYKVHPELADIDFNHFFSDETSKNLKTKLVPVMKMSSRRISPDIFEDFSQPIYEPKIKEKSPLKLAVVPSTQVSPCLLTKKTLTWREVRRKYGKPSQSDLIKPVTEQPNESIIHVPSKTRSKRRIFKSDSDSSDSGSTQPQRSRDVVPGTLKTACRSSLRKVKNPINDFIDGEAVLSGSASEDEFENTIGCYMADSMVVHDDEVENDLVNMTEVYLQSVRSPSRNSGGAFKIPERRQYNDASKIFSQKVPEDNGSYMNDTFVVSDEEADVEKSMCPLERAEAILKAKRRAKRKAKLIDGHEMKEPAKKRRILRIRNSSEDDDDFV